MLHASQRQSWPPSAAVRQARMSSMARRCEGSIDSAVNRELVRREAAENLGELDHESLYQRPVMLRRSSRPWSDAWVGVVRCV